MEAETETIKTITAVGDHYSLSVWRDGARLKAKLFDKNGTALDTFELKIGDILSQAGINLNEIMGEVLPGPLGFLARHIK